MVVHVIVTMTALRNVYSPEQIRRAGTLHTTNKAFDRYLMVNAADSKELYTTASRL